ncbi:proteasome-interacting protein cic1 [Elasticomyces elasticus]|nr:proteasome-interacting protein cic1 [Elasticomyces elasticus]
MAPVTAATATTAVTTKAASGSPYQLDPSQSLRATTSLVKHIKSQSVKKRDSAPKVDLLADAGSDEEDGEGETGKAGAEGVPIWLTLTTKKHIVDQKRLKPGKIPLPHPLNSPTNPNLRVCLITADPQRTYKDILTHPSFPPALASKVQRVIGITKLKAKYKPFENRRQLLSEYDIFLADDRIITSLPQALGKIFYKGGAKRPVPVSLEGRREKAADGVKRLKISEGGPKIVKAAPEPAAVAREIERALSCALVHLAPGASTSVKIGYANLHTPEQLRDNIEAVVTGLVEKYVPKQWRGVRAFHVKGPNTMALPIWLADELWEDEADVLEEPKVDTFNKKMGRKKSKKGAVSGGEAVRAIEAPVEDKKRKAIDGDGAEVAEKPKKKKRKSEGGTEGPDTDVKARKEKLRRLKDEAAKDVDGEVKTSKTKKVKVPA